MYADVDWTLPLFWKWKLVTKDQGEWFGPSHNDNSTDTLYRNDWTTNLSIPIFSNLSVGPGLELFSYENKVGHTHLLRVSPMMKINYTFDKYSAGTSEHDIEAKRDAIPFGSYSIARATIFPLSSFSTYPQGTAGSCVNIVSHLSAIARA